MDLGVATLLVGAISAVTAAWTAYQEIRWRSRCYTCPYYRRAVAAGEDETQFSPAAIAAGKSV